MKKSLSFIDNNDLILAITLFQKLHPYTEILGISKEKYTDFSKDKKGNIIYYDAFIFKTNKNKVTITTNQIIEKLFGK